MQHPAIVRVFDYGTTSTGTAYLAMEFLEGESLRTRLLRVRQLSEAVTVRIGRQIASGLATAHASQVVHRDLKPENIFMVPDAEAPSGERAKILDFGIANHTCDFSVGNWRFLFVIGKCLGIPQRRGIRANGEGCGIATYARPRSIPFQYRIGSA